MSDKENGIKKDEFKKDNQDYLTNYNGFNFLDTLGLNQTEIKILKSINMGKPAAMISRHTKISETTLSYSLKKLHKRKLVRALKNNKRVYWKSNIQRVISWIRNLPTPSSKYPTR